MAEGTIGLVGWGGAAQSLALHMARCGLDVRVHPLEGPEPMARPGSHPRRGITFCERLAELLEGLTPPRDVMLLSPKVDGIMGSLLSGLEEEDRILDLGDSFFLDTERRSREAQSTGIRYLGVGMGTGRFGALVGRCLMVGGDPVAYREVTPLISALAAPLKSGSPCTAFVGPRGAGHYAGMVHTALVQSDHRLIVEAYELLQGISRQTPGEIGQVFGAWNEGPLGSLLLEMGSRILAQKSVENGPSLARLLSDGLEENRAVTRLQEVADTLNLAVPSLVAALSPLRAGTRTGSRTEDPGTVEEIRQCFQAARICALAQAMMLLSAADEPYEYIFNMPRIARTWQGNGLVPSRLLEETEKALEKDPCSHLTRTQHFSTVLMEARPAWRRTVERAEMLGIACPVIKASLTYAEQKRDG
jgi:6-phosphogluconate dehydrogenase